MSEPTPQTPAAESKSLEELLAEAQATLEQQRDSTLRALAEADNARKRAQSEIAGAHRYALERFAESLLPVVDSLEAALKAKDLSGVELTLKQLQAVFEKSSIREIDPAPGERFDPHRHQAVAAVEADAEANAVVSVLQKGWCLHDRVIRPAMVTVARPRPLEIPGGNPISDTGLDSN